jgi:hypothetical protein
MSAALASMAAVPVAIAVTPYAVAAFHLVIALVIVVAAVPTIVSLSAQRQSADTEDHQQAKYYQFLHKEVSPFRDLKYGFVTEGTVQGLQSLCRPLPRAKPSHGRGDPIEAALTPGYCVSRFQREERCLDNPIACRDERGNQNDPVATARGSDSTTFALRDRC